MHLRPIEEYRPSVLVVDSSAAIRNGIESALSLRGLRIFSAPAPQNIQAAIQAKQIDLVLADLVVDSRNRDALIAAIRIIAKRSPNAVPVVAMSGRAMWEDLGVFSAADAIGASAVLRKPFSTAALLQLLDKLLGPAAAGGDEPLTPRLALNEDRAADPWTALH